MGPPYLAAASIQALMELLPTMLTPGIAYPCSLALAKRSLRACPVTTPGLTLAGSLVKACQWDRKRVENACTCATIRQISSITCSHTYLGLGGFGHLEGRSRSVDADSRAESSSGGDQEEGVGKLHRCKLGLFSR
jgi:hypothetical protein